MRIMLGTTLSQGLFEALPDSQSASDVLVRKLKKLEVWYCSVRCIEGRRT